VGAAAGSLRFIRPLVAKNIILKGATLTSRHLSSVIQPSPNRDKVQLLIYLRASDTCIDEVEEMLLNQACSSPSISLPSNV
jgi:hypothetical protein